MVGPVQIEVNPVDKNLDVQERFRVYATFRKPMRHEFAGEATMSSFDSAKERRTRLGSTTDVERRLPRGRALLMIGVLSALSWLVLIALFMALRAFL
jgi:hypothetical protein